MPGPGQWPRLCSHENAPMGTDQPGTGESGAGRDLKTCGQGSWAAEPGMGVRAWSHLCCGQHASAQVLACPGPGLQASAGQVEPAARDGREESAEPHQALNQGQGRTRSPT